MAEQRIDIMKKLGWSGDTERFDPRMPNLILQAGGMVRVDSNCAISESLAGCCFHLFIFLIKVSLLYHDKINFNTNVEVLSKLKYVHVPFLKYMYTSSQVVIIIHCRGWQIWRRNLIHYLCQS